MAILSHLSEQLAARLGLDALRFNREGHLTLLDQGLEVDFQINEAQDLLCIYFEIGQLSESISNLTLQALLLANYFGIDTEGFNLGLEPQTRALVLSKTLPIACLTVEDILDILQNVPRVRDDLLTRIDVTERRAHCEPEGHTTAALEHDRHKAVEMLIRI